MFISLNIMGAKRMNKHIQDNKRNNLRFFYPNEWFRFISEVVNPKHSFWFKLLINTGLRINEARTLLVSDVNLERRYMTIRQGKGNKQRQVFFSTAFKSEILQYIKQNKLIKDSSFNIPSTQFMDKVIKKYASKSQLDNSKDFSCHTFRKTHENYLCALGINTMIVTMQLGHTVNVATSYYVSQFLKPDEKTLIKSILGDLFEVDNSYRNVNQTQGGTQENNSFSLN